MHIVVWLVSNGILGSILLFANLFSYVSECALLAHRHKQLQHVMTRILDLPWLFYSEDHIDMGSAFRDVAMQVMAMWLWIALFTLPFMYRACRHALDALVEETLLFVAEVVRGGETLPTQQSLHGMTRLLNDIMEETLLPYWQRRFGEATTCLLRSCSQQCGLTRCLAR